MKDLLKEIESCTVCSSFFMHDPRPIIKASQSSSVLIIGQAPGMKVHTSGIPWDDASGRNLRDWMGISNDLFYNEQVIALVPMGFCYPGKGKSGDLPPRPECAPLWHQRVLEACTSVKLTLLIGQYAQRYYLGNKAKSNLTETVRSYEEYFPNYFPLPHPSPRNRIWMSKNPWFEAEVLVKLKETLKQVIS